METYWHRLCRSLPQTSYPDALPLAKATGRRPSVSSYHKLWEMIRPSGKTAEGLALLSEACRLWPKATSLKVELATLHLDQGDGRQVTQLISIAEAQKDPACGWLVLKAALLCNKTEWVRVLSSSLAIAKLDKAKLEERCLEYCGEQLWQEAADCVRRHHGLPLIPATDSLAPSRPSSQQPRSADVLSGREAQFSASGFVGCMGADCKDLADWLNNGAVTAEHGPWRTWLVQLQQGESSAPLAQGRELPQSLQRIARQMVESRECQGQRSQSQESRGPISRGPESKDYDRMAQKEAEAQGGQKQSRKELVTKLLSTVKNQQPSS